MSSIRPPFFFRWLSPKYLLCELPAEEKVIYVTFDDGPVPEATQAVLEILKRFGAKATFFVVGDNVRRYPDVFENIRQDGHSVGNHTFHHLNGWHTSPGAYIDDVYRCRDLFETNLFRPPYGRFTPSQYLLLRKDFRFILWSVITYDFQRNTTPEKCLRNAIDYTGSGSIVLFHDSVKALEKVTYALPRFLEHFGNMGYRFDVLSQSVPSSAKL